MTSPDPVAIPATHRDLLDIPTGVLATISLDGLPQVTATWFWFDPSDGLLKLSLSDKRQKAKNLRRDGRATFFLIDPASPYRTLEIRADVELLPDDDFSFAATVGAKYGMNVHDLDGPDDTRSVVILHPVKVNAYQQD